MKQENNGIKNLPTVPETGIEIVTELFFKEPLSQLDKFSNLVLDHLY